MITIHNWTVIVVAIIILLPICIYEVKYIIPHRRHCRKIADLDMRNAVKEARKLIKK